MVTKNQQWKHEVIIEKRGLLTVEHSYWDGKYYDSCGRAEVVVDGQRAYVSFWKHGAYYEVTVEGNSKQSRRKIYALRDADEAIEACNSYILKKTGTIHAA